ncbi:hypothetical protein QOT17_008088 [Balamuthia mandrillaris]
MDAKEERTGEEGDQEEHEEGKEQATRMQAVFPITRIKKIVKSDPDVKLISTDAVHMISKSTELFLDYLTKQAYTYTQEEGKKTLQYRDLAKCVEEVDVLDFLLDIIPPTENIRSPDFPNNNPE